MVIDAVCAREGDGAACDFDYGFWQASGECGYWQRCRVVPAESRDFCASEVYVLIFYCGYFTTSELDLMLLTLDQLATLEAVEPRKARQVGLRVLALRVEPALIDLVAVSRINALHHVETFHNLADGHLHGDLPKPGWLPRVRKRCVERELGP